MLIPLSKLVNPIFPRVYAEILRARLLEPRRFIQVIAGPRQVGKTTLVRQVTQETARAVHFASADGALLEGPEWMGQHRSAARDNARASPNEGAILVLDEVQKTPDCPSAPSATGTKTRTQVVRCMWRRGAASRSSRRAATGSSGATPLNPRSVLTSPTPRHQEFELFYWRERNREVDFVIRAGQALVAIEVKSGRRRGMPLNDFLAMPVQQMAAHLTVRLCNADAPRLYYRVIHGRFCRHYLTRGLCARVDARRQNSVPSSTNVAFRPR